MAAKKEYQYAVRVSQWLSKPAAKQFAEFIARAGWSSAPLVRREKPKRKPRK